MVLSLCFFLASVFPSRALCVWLLLTVNEAEFFLSFLWSSSRSGLYCNLNTKRVVCIHLSRFTPITAYLVAFLTLGFGVYESSVRRRIQALRGTAVGISLVGSDWLGSRGVECNGIDVDLFLCICWSTLILVLTVWYCVRCEVVRCGHLAAPVWGCTSPLLP